MVFFINYLTLRQAAAPEALRGRVIATMICLTVAAGPLGGLAGGWIAEHAGLRARSGSPAAARCSSFCCGVGLAAPAVALARGSAAAARRERRRGARRLAQARAAPQVQLQLQARWRPP